MKAASSMSEENMDVNLKPALVLLAFVGLLAGCMKEPFSTNADFGNSSPSGKSSATCAQNAIPNQYVVRWRDGHVSLMKGANPRELMRGLSQSKADQIEAVEPNYRIHMDIASDRNLQSNADVPPSANWGYDIVDAKQAATEGVTGAGVIVGVVDTGVDITHPQLASHIYTNVAELNGKPGVDDDGNGYVDDVHGWNFVTNSPLTGDNQLHGTHVSGIIAADPSQGPVEGVAPHATILPTAFLDDQGNGTTANAILAMEYSLNLGAKVINASWGGSGCSVVMENLIASMANKGALFVNAAGNDGVDIDTSPSYPASFAGNPNMLSMITVAASDWNDVEAGFSNDGYNSVDLAAPGMDITSTVPGGGDATLSGTSMATPFVSGAVALLWSDRPKATPQQIRDAIFNSVDAGPYRVLTQGRLDVAKALAYIEQHVSK